MCAYVNVCRYLYKEKDKWQTSVEITPYALSWMQEVQTILQTYTGTTK